MSMLLYLISRAIIIIFFVGLIPHRQRGCSRITWGSVDAERPFVDYPHVIFLLSPVFPSPPGRGRQETGGKLLGGA